MVTKLHCSVVGFGVLTLTLFMYGVLNRTVQLAQRQRDLLRVAPKTISRSRQSLLEPAEDKSMACKFPILDPWSPEIKRFLPSFPPKLNCPLENLVYQLDPKTSTLTKTNSNSSIWINCCYKAIFRLAQNEESFSDCIPLNNLTLQIPPKHEFLAVHCDHAVEGNKSVMVQVLAHVPLKQEVEARVRNDFSKWSSDSVNLVIHVWDAVSEMEFQRATPKLRKFLLEDLSAFMFQGYGKVGDNSLPNLSPLLTGRMACQDERGMADGCPTIYKEFAKRGYRTSEAYDMPGHWIWKFQDPSTDYYFRPMARVATKWIGTHWAESKESPLCWGPRMVLESLLDYMKATASTMGKEKRYVQFALSGALTHDHHLYGSLGEEVMIDFLEWMKGQGHLNQTVFVFMSDHGQLRTKARVNPQGRIESKMPILYILFPDWFLVKYPKAMTNIRVNRDRLASPYDTHVTFLDLVDLSRIEDDVISQRAKDLDKDPLPHGISLFLPIPKRRTCKMAAIDPPWCVCDLRTPLSPSSSEARLGAEYAVSVLNDFLSKEKRCAQLTLGSVTDGSRLQLPMEDNKSGDWFELAFTTSPSNASFEAVVSRGWSGVWSLSGAVSRTNTYGNAASCLDGNDDKGRSRELKPYCFCLPE